MPGQDLPHLSDLIWLGRAAVSLQVDQVFDSWQDEHMVTPSRPFLEAKLPQQVAEVGEPNARIRPA